MNAKNTVCCLLLLANMYGEVSTAKEVKISEARLAKLSAEHLDFLSMKNLIRIENSEVFLDLDRLEGYLRSCGTTDSNGQVKAIRITAIPYGCT